MAPVPLCAAAHGCSPLAVPVAQLYADSYTLSGCQPGDRLEVTEACGVFRRVDAHCTDTMKNHCPGGAIARQGWNDARLCDAAPVYQLEGATGTTEGGSVLYRNPGRGGGTLWVVGSAERLGDCSAADGGIFFSSVTSGASTPDAAGYMWSSPQGQPACRADLCPFRGMLHIVAGGGARAPSPPPPLPSSGSTPGPYLGCFADDPDHDRATPDDLSGIPYGYWTAGGVPTDQYGNWRVSDPSTALADCARICSGYSYMGLQWAWQCFCGDSYGAFGPAGGCGEQGQNCGNGVEDGNPCSYMNAVFALTEAGGGGGAPSPPPGGKGDDGGKGR